MPEQSVQDPPATEVPEWLDAPEYEELLNDNNCKNYLVRYKTEQEAVKASWEHKQLLSSSFRLPDNLSDEQIKELSGRLNEINKVPDNAEKYELFHPESLGELDISEKTKMEFRAFAKENNLSPKSVQAGYELMLRMMSESGEAEDKNFTETNEKRNEKSKALWKQYWGPVEYEKIMGKLNDESDSGLIGEFAQSRAVDSNEYKEFAEELEQTGMRTNALLGRLLGDAAKMYSVLEKNATVNEGEFAASKGVKILSKNQKNAEKFPNTPRSLGGGKPD